MMEAMVIITYTEFEKTKQELKELRKQNNKIDGFIKADGLGKDVDYRAGYDVIVDMAELEKYIRERHNCKGIRYEREGGSTSTHNDATLNVRCEADIENIAKELSKLVKREASRKGVTF